MSARPELGSARALAWLYSPGAQRAVFEALVGVEAEVGASLAPGLEHSVAHARVAWWREECERCAAGESQHPLTRRLQQLFGEHRRTCLAGLRGFVDAATWDLAGATFETRRELSAYCERWSAALVEPLACFAPAQAGRADVRAFGRALHEMELLSSLGGDARLGRVRIPLDELEAAGENPERLARAPWTPGLTRFVRMGHERARTALALASNALPEADQPRLRALLVWANLAHQRSLRISAALPLAMPTGDHHFPLDGWRAWRAARRADSGRFRLPAD